MHRVEYLETQRIVPEYNPHHLKNVDIALVLGGGGSKGYAHLGVLEVLEENKIPINLIVGTSAGSIVGALYADDPHIKRVKKKCDRIDGDLMLTKHYSSALYGLMRGEYLKSFLGRNLLHKRIEDFSMPFVAVSASLETNQPVLIGAGPVIPAVHASAAIPLLFVPVYAYNQHLIDGGVVEPVPVRAAKLFNPKMIIAVDISTTPQRTKDYNKLSIFEGYNALGIAYHAAHISYYELAKIQREWADVVIIPDVKGFDYLDGTHKQEMYRRGKAAAREVLSKIRAHMKVHNIKHKQ
jgi:NTE family protein